jgi:hypothetical protein
MYGNTTGNNNTACGLQALQGNTTGFNNTAVGMNALHLNTTGAENIAMGYEALLNNTTGGENVAIGIDALYHNTEGNSNVGIGYHALYLNDAYGGNTAIGSLTEIVGYFDATAIGVGAEVFGGTGINATALGYNAIANAPNTIRLGNTQVTSIGGYVNWSNLSDGRYKKNIKADVPGLAFINGLKPVTYNLDITGINDHFNKIRASLISADEKTNQHPDQDKEGAKAKEQIVYSGFVAQDVEATAKKLGYNFSGVDAPKNENDLYGLRYAEFVVPLVKAVQELSKMNDDKDVQIEDLQKQSEAQQKINQDLQNRLAKLEAVMDISSSAANQPTSNIKLETSNSWLEQNIPNPFNHSTTINYSLPPQYSSAKIIVTDKSGKVLKEVNLSGSGRGSLNIDASSISSGAYQYSLYLDGKLVATKQMEHIH